jgi:hypothetical protein
MQHAALVFKIGEKLFVVKLFIYFIFKIDEKLFVVKLFISFNGKLKPLFLYFFW